MKLIRARSPIVTQGFSVVVFATFIEDFGKYGVY